MGRHHRQAKTTIYLALTGYIFLFSRSFSFQQTFSSRHPIQRNLCNSIKPHSFLGLEDHRKNGFLLSRSQLCSKTSSNASLIQQGKSDRIESINQSQPKDINTLVNQKVVQPGASNLRVQLLTLVRVGLPSLLAGIAGFFLFPFFSLFLASIMNDAGVFSVLSQDSSQFVQNFLTVSGLLFSILVGQTYYFMYQQQESVYYALFQEVTEAKSLLEQVALVCQGRSMYTKVLESISQYVRNDLKQLQADPAVLLSARPVDDPLEAIMYYTSVGVPSSVYDTVRSLRQARSNRLGALQRKLPPIHMLLLWVLGVIEMISFPLLGAGTQTIGGYNILTVEGCLFGIMTFGIIATLRVVDELWRPAGGAYNVDAVLSTMVLGLEDELNSRMKGTMFSEDGRFPTLDNKRSVSMDTKSTDAFHSQLLTQGSIDFLFLYNVLNKVLKWVRKKASTARRN